MPAVDDGDFDLDVVGSNLDHIVVGRGVYNQIRRSEEEAYVFDDAWPSDHKPMAWAAELSFTPANDSFPAWRRGIAWHKVNAHNRAAFNRRFQYLVRGDQSRRQDWSMLVVESALTKAAFDTLPRSRDPRKRPQPLDPAGPALFNTRDTERRLQATAAKYSDARARSNAVAASQRDVLIQHASIDPTPSSCWAFIRKFFCFGNTPSLKPPLETDIPGVKVTTAAERVEALAKTYAAVHSDPAFSLEKAQQELDRAIAELPKIEPHDGASQATRGSTSVTELRACMAGFQTGKASDFMGIKVEHLRQLDDASLALIVPFFDRSIERGTVPDHWRMAVVSPVPKPKRDLAIRRNWRPVSVTALLCRTCEAIVHNRIQHRIENGVDANGKPLRRGNSQFGFRRGVGTSLPLAGLSMFIRDGQLQKAEESRWNARDPSSTMRDADPAPSHQHDALLVCVDGSDAFCRAVGAKAVRRLNEMGLVTEARWVAELLKNRSLTVREGDVYSKYYNVERGVPQGSILGPLLWSLVIDDLVELCEAECAAPVPGCTAVPIIFADDINFIVRGFNPSSMIEQANRLLRVVDNWSRDNGIPMAKLQASWIAPPRKGDYIYRNWTSADGEIILNSSVRCTPGVAPIKILGVTYDTDFKFHAHVENVVEQCTRFMRLLTAMSSSVKAEKLAVLYRGLILSRMLYAIEAWYPYISMVDRTRLQNMHRDCCLAITGCRAGSDGTSVCFEAGFYSFDAIANDEMIKLGDRLRRHPTVPGRRRHEPVYGPDWVTALFRDEPTPTAYVRRAGPGRQPNPASWPPADLDRTSSRYRDSTGFRGLALRDIGIRLHHGNNDGDTRKTTRFMRPLPRVFPFAPQELAVFDNFVTFDTSAPRGLTKPENFEQLTPDQKREFADANAERVDRLQADNPDALFAFTDGSRREGKFEACAGAYLISRTAQPVDADDPAIIHQGMVAANPIACIYTGELLPIYQALSYINAHRELLPSSKRVVLITDSKSSLESVKTTWLRRIGHLEQRVSRLLYELSVTGVHVTLSFVFSHAGGCSGNAIADKFATYALGRVGHKWTGELWNVDTTRRIQRHFHDLVEDHLDRSKFRARNVPRNGRGKIVPSERLPQSITRSDEILLYRARVGTMPDIGGFLHRVAQECPLCREEALGRDGATVDHLLECGRHYIEGLTSTCATLWEDPIKAVADLRAIEAVAATTGLGYQPARRHLRRQPAQQLQPQAVACTTLQRT